MTNFDAKTIASSILDGAHEGQKNGTWDYLCADNDAELAVEFYWTDTLNLDDFSEITSEQTAEVTELVDAGLTVDRKRYIAGQIESASDLSELRDFLSRVDVYAAETHVDAFELYDVTELPVFGGDAPRSSVNVYSYDEGCVLSISDNRDWAVVAR